MKRVLVLFMLLSVLLVLLTGCGPALQATPPTLVPAPTAAPAPTVAPAPTLLPAPSAVAPSTMAERVERVDAMLTGLSDNARFSGAVLIAEGDQVLLRKGYGYANRASQSLNTPETVFRIGNLTQPLTAAGVLLLEAQGQLSVQDSICAYLDDCPTDWEPITLHHLLSNSSGLPGYALYGSQRATAITPEGLIELIRDKPVKFRPGSQWDWDLPQSNFVLLGMVIERVSGQPYDTFMAEQIFAPLGMDATVYAPQPEGLALGYEGRGTNTKPAEPFDLSVAYAAYGLSSTLDDMYRWNRALLNGDLLPPAQREAMLAAHIRDSYGWGHGYATITSDQVQPGHHVVSIGVPWTSYPGFWASNVALTDLDLTVVVLANRGYGIREDPIMPFMSDILVGAPYLNPGS